MSCTNIRIQTCIEAVGHDLVFSCVCVCGGGFGLIPGTDGQDPEHGASRAGQSGPVDRVAGTRAPRPLHPGGGSRGTCGYASVAYGSDVPVFAYDSLVAP